MDELVNDQQNSGVYVVVNYVFVAYTFKHNKKEK